MVRRQFWLLLVLLLVNVACGAGEGEEAQRVSFFISGDPAERGAYLALVEAFHEAHGDIRIEVTHIPSDREYRTRLVTEFAGGTPPDISLMNYRRIPSFAANNLLEPLGPYLEESEVIAEEDFYPQAIEAFKWQAELLCLPQNISSLVVYYNEDLFDAAGVPYPPDKWTWDDFVATAKALTRNGDGDGRIDQYGLGVEPSLYRLAPFIWQNNAPLVDNDLAPGRLTLTRPPTLEALQWFVDLRQVHGVVPSREEEASQDSESRFVAGTTAMFLDSRRGTPTYRQITAFTWDVAPLPNGKTSAGILHSDAYCLARTTENKEAAWRFIEFANSAEGQAIIAGTGRTVPSLIEVAESDAFLNPGLPPGRARVFLDSIAVLRRVPLASTWQEIETIASEEIERAFYGDITVQEAATLAVQRTEEYFLLAQFAVQP
ncbi:MAG: sugar ABC transporter substrate-binding protein [Chloroflexi bacterium]|nr:sugar ABC transporter substrate-binding protein [Chloroflexota bacterium]MCI0579394.1 sugar ABC transporter substrate-binding protein [Chloroflexota bacterium]MCI0643780.1 sugar ABC transporter substrate-binding protein [Chloroflexota bacterium]MCI0730032.1 sugar ABC transporter substrate-binding protein [Chloroflexota bacterium]